MTFFLYTLAFLCVVSLLILIHEFGHFLVARLFQVRVTCFSFGFGKPFYSWKSKNGFTEYYFTPFILGGYVKLLDSREASVPVDQYRFAFDRKPILQRLAIISAGPLANAIFTFLAFWLMFIIGFNLPKPIIGQVVKDSIAAQAGLIPDEEIVKIDEHSTDNWSAVIIAMISRIGDSGSLNIATRAKLNQFKNYQLDLSTWKVNEYNPDPLLDFGLKRYKPIILPLVDKIDRNSPAEKYGLQKGDRIIAIMDRKIDNWDDFIQEIKLYPEQIIGLTIVRVGKNINLTVTTGWKFGKGWRKEGFLGVSSDESRIVWPRGTLRNYHYNAFSAFPIVWQQMKLFSYFNYIIFGKLLTKKISLRILGGPIATFVASGQVLEHGLIAFLNFLAIISLTLAFVNLLPFPGLDGGYLVMFLVEAIVRRPISIHVETLITRLGFALFIFLILQTTANDLIRTLNY